MGYMVTKTITISLDAYIQSLKPSAELADNIEKAMMRTRKAKLRQVEFQ